MTLNKAKQIDRLEKRFLAEIKKSAQMRTKIRGLQRQDQAARTTALFAQANLAQANLELNDLNEFISSLRRARDELARKR